MAISNEPYAASEGHYDVADPLHSHSDDETDASQLYYDKISEFSRTFYDDIIGTAQPHSDDVTGTAKPYYDDVTDTVRPSFKTGMENKMAETSQVDFSCPLLGTTELNIDSPTSSTTATIFNNGDDSPTSFLGPRRFSDSPIAGASDSPITGARDSPIVGAGEANFMGTRDAPIVGDSPTLGSGDSPISIRGTTNSGSPTSFVGTYELHSDGSVKLQDCPLYEIIKN